MHVSFARIFEKVCTVALVKPILTTPTDYIESGYAERRLTLEHSERNFPCHIKIFEADAIKAAFKQIYNDRIE